MAAFAKEFSGGDFIFVDGQTELSSFEHFHRPRNDMSDNGLHTFLQQSLCAAGFGRR